VPLVLVSYGPSGGLQWQRFYRGSGVAFPSELVELTGGDLVVTGHGFWSPGRRADALILRLDSLGFPRDECHILDDTIAFFDETFDAVATSQQMSSQSTQAVIEDLPGWVQDSPASRYDPCGCPSYAWHPGEVSPRQAWFPLTFEDRESLRWASGHVNDSCSFNVYRGDLELLARGRYGDCLAARVTDNGIRDPESPPPGTCWFYVVTGVNAAGEGPMGLDSRSMQRVNWNPCP
jgi:hypothetical protein